MNKFVLSTNQATPAQRNAITEALRKPELGWWHWFPDIWLIVDASGQHTEDSLLEVLHPLVPEVFMLMLNVTGSRGFRGWGPKNMGEWLDKQWQER